MNKQESEKIKILYEDDVILVCVKPAGIPTQSRRVGTPDMETLLKNHIAQQSSKKPPYLAVIHRLDQPVEGLLVFAKTPAAARSLNAQLTARGFGKHYRALLEGVPVPSEGTLEHYLCKDARTNTSAVCPPGTPGAKKARLQYQVVHTDGHRSIVDITLDTGRHHQIRAQMAAIDCPLVGDVKYGWQNPAGTPADNAKYGWQNPAAAPADNAKYGWQNPAGMPTGRGRIELYACRLEFCHPLTNNTMRFELPALPL